jgi:hypothetical protein
MTLTLTIDLNNPAHMLLITKLDRYFDLKFEIQEDENNNRRLSTTVTLTTLLTAIPDIWIAQVIKLELS